MAEVTKKKRKFKLIPNKENVAKVLTAVGVVGIGATLIAKREKVKQLVHKLMKAKKSA